MKDIKVMTDYLPRHVTLIKPSSKFASHYPRHVTEIQVDYVEFETADIIHAFLRLQEQALEEAQKIKDYNRRSTAIMAIRNMVYFK